MFTLLGALAALSAAVIGLLVAFTSVISHRVQNALPARGSFVEIDGARIHYIDKGTGPVLLFIHGLGGHIGNFTHSLVHRLTPEYRVIVMERPGSGHSTRPSEMSAHLRAQARVVVQFIDALGLDRPTIVGHSLGGAVALALALDAPDKVGALALIAPLTQVQHAVPEPFTSLSIASPIVRTIVAWTIAVPAAILRRERILESLFGPDDSPKDFATAGGGILSLRPMSFISTSRDLVATNTDLASMVERYPSLRVPVAILFGREDRVLDARAHGEVMRSIVPGLRLELIAGGHMLPISAPDRTADFIRSVTPP